METRLASPARLLALFGESAALPTGATLIIFGHDGIVEQRGIRLPYQPHVHSSPTIAPAVFADAEAEEFQRGNLQNAAASYSRLA